MSGFCLSDDQRKYATYVKDLESRLDALEAENEKLRNADLHIFSAPDKFVNWCEEQRMFGGATLYKHEIDAFYLAAVHTSRLDSFAASLKNEIASLREKVERVVRAYDQWWNSAAGAETRQNRKALVDALAALAALTGQKENHEPR